MTGLLALIVVFAGVPLLLLITDRLGWTAAYTRKKRTSSRLGSTLLGVDNIFAPEHRRAAREYRIDKKLELRERKADDQPKEASPPSNS